MSRSRTHGARRRSRTRKGGAHARKLGALFAALTPPLDEARTRALTAVDALDFERTRSEVRAFARSCRERAARGELDEQTLRAELAKAGVVLTLVDAIAAVLVRALARGDAYALERVADSADLLRTRMQTSRLLGAAVIPRGFLQTSVIWFELERLQNVYGELASTLAPGGTRDEARLPPFPVACRAADAAAAACD